MYIIKESKKFRKSVRKYLRSGKLEREYIQNIIEILATGGRLESRHKDHELKGKLGGTRECYIEPDVLLFYQIDDENGILFLINIGSHSELFK